jgi:tetratricopeptide (TPR) repeat protein
MRLRIWLIFTMMLAISPVHCLGQAAASTGAQRQAAANPQRQTALALEQQGKNAEAEAAWRVYLKAHPTSPEPYAHLGLLEARQEHYKEAVPLYRKALALGQKIPSLELNLGLAYFKGGELKESIQVFAPLLKGEPANSPQAQQLTILLGMAHYGLGEYADAVPYLKAAAQADAQNLQLRLTLAHSCLWTKQYQCVLDVYHEILLLNAESAEADMLAGEVLDETKDSAGAIQQFRAAAKANPRQPDVHFGLGYLLWTQNQYDEAAVEFQAELANNPNHVQAMIYLGDTQMQLNHPEAALPLLESSLSIDAGRELAHLDLGILYNQAGRRDDALRELMTAEKLNPNDENVHWRLGRLYQAAGRKDEAKAEFDTTRALQKAVEDTLAKKLQEAQEKAKSAEPAPGELPAK